MLAACILEYIIPLLYLPVFTIWVSATKQTSDTHKLFIVWVSAIKQASHTHTMKSLWVSATKQASHTHKLFTLRRKKGTEKLAPVSCAHVEAEEGYRLACFCLLCPRWGERRGTGGTCPVYGSPTLRAMHSIHKCVAKDAPHLFHWRLSPYKVKNKNSVLWASSQIAVFVLTLHGS